jgi:lipoprotein-releasing system ATP-binding protein
MNVLGGERWMTMLQVSSLRKSYPSRAGALEVLRGVSFVLQRGESAVIMGPSGSGKSTLLNILGTLEPPDEGDVLLDRVNPFHLGPDELARFRNERIGFIFQDHHLLPQCTMLENVLLPTMATGRRRDAVSNARKLLAWVGLSDRSDHRPSELSGGERQRAAIARALVNDPALLLADEPTGQLDRRTAESVADLLLNLHARANNVLVVVTHNERLAERFERRLDLTDGRLTPRGDRPSA